MPRQLLQQLMTYLTKKLVLLYKKTLIYLFNNTDTLCSLQTDRTPGSAVELTSDVSGKEFQTFCQGLMEHSRLS